jgi:hypothetical protein
MNSIIQSANLLTIEDPASYIRHHTKCSFIITEEECNILERMKRSQDMTEYKEYISKMFQYISSVICPNCDECITVPQKYICCSQLLQNNIHDERCMYKEN